MMWRNAGFELGDLGKITPFQHLTHLVQSRDHCGFPCGVLRYMCAWIAVIFPILPEFRNIIAS